MSSTTDLGQMGMDATLSELYRLFRAANQQFYGGELPEPQITVQAANSRSAYGWCTTRKVWVPSPTGDDEPIPPERVVTPQARYEINLCAEFLHRGALPAAETLLHEMVHLHHLEQGIRDVSGFQYHNERFKEGAETHELSCQKVGRFGWAKTDLLPDTALWVMSQNLNPAAFALAREMRRPLAPPGGTTPPPAGGTGTTTTAGGTGSSTKMERWACGCTNIRCAVELQALCFRCGKPFVKGAKAQPNKQDKDS